MKPVDLPVLLFSDAQEWEHWLAENHTKSSGVWLRFFKKNSKVESINYTKALDEALCYGWIDSQLKKYDSEAYLQKFTPRRKQSIWSRRNIEHITRLEKEKRMKPAGLAEVEAAKADGRWQQAYESQSNTAMPKDFLLELAKNQQAKSFFESLNKANIYSITWRLQTAKTVETRQKRMKTILDMLAKGEKFH